MAWKHPESTAALGLTIYLLIVGLGAMLLIAANFPTTTADGNVEFATFIPLNWVPSDDQAMALMAFLAGVTGSFLHASQSLASYVGNGEFKTSWATWYFLRPWIGGILGFSLYFVFRAGLIGGAGTFNPYGLIAVGLLGGWFSKTTTDKLQEVFETLFKTEADKERKDKLTPTTRTATTQTATTQ